MLLALWYKIPLDIVQNLYEPIPRRTAAVLRKKMAQIYVQYL
jgi:hypothetical protein